MFFLLAYVNEKIQNRLYIKLAIKRRNKKEKKYLTK